MATFLYELGRFAFRRRGLVTLLWMLIVVGVGAAASSAPTPPTEQFSMPGTESQKAFDLLEEKFPDAGADGATARVVLRAPEGGKIADEKPAIETLLGELGEAPQVAGVADPFAAGTISRDGRTAYAVVTYEVTAPDLTDEAHDALTEATDRARDGGLTVEAGGDAVPIEQTVSGTGEQIGVLISAIVLLLTFGSVIAAGMPLLTALIGVGVGVSGITALGSTLGLSATTSTLAMMIGLAVGIDYALFIVSRYRSEIAEGRAPQEAAGIATGTAGSAVVFAGLTVIIALGGLAVVGIPILTKMAMAAAGTVAVAVLIAVTFVPALLGFAPRRVVRVADRRLVRAKKPLSARMLRKSEAKTAKLAARTRPNLSTRWASFVVRRPLGVLLLAVVGLGAIALPATKLELGLPGEGTMATDTTQRKAYDLLSDSFGPGFNGPLTMAVEGEDAAAAGRRIGEELKKDESVASVSAATANEAGDTAIFSIVPKTGPTDTETEELVKDIRARATALEASSGATEILVTGQTAMFIDFSRTLSDALLPYLGLVVGLAFLLLLLVFRSLLVPLKAALGFLFSVSAALGALVAVFQLGWASGFFGVEQTGPIMTTLPIFMIGVVFGLAMDYEVFLVTRMREAYVHGASAKDAVVTGFRHSGRVVAAAAIIMISVFSGFVLETDDLVAMMGFGLAAAVLFDAFVVRMVIVPAVHSLLGDAAWWLPRWLDRLLPNVDVEGEKLQRRLRSAAPPKQRGATDHERDLVH
ncbi:MULTISPECIES: MMPL family transporter [unclassified Streptomyces]|uniref:MMPL family transporter n=1 Tax=unclassified Streptomyces TaxID=2593676 RepID=UPI002441B6AC|nr:MMPL family transporter [Streptomyces sp. DH41]MDG9723731.1 MMPL family transporter [Streptomyces sp. DH41]